MAAADLPVAQQRPAHLGRAWTEAASGQDVKVSRDKNFAAKVADVVGLYLNPVVPENHIRA